MPTTIACASDIHGMWGPILESHPRALSERWTAEVVYPPADFLILAGDIIGNYSTARGDYGELAQQLNELVRLNAFFAELKKAGVYREVIYVSGNHDWVCQKQTALVRARLTDVIYLQDEAVTLGTRDGGVLKFYGSPWTPWFWDWSFNFPDHNENFARARAHARACWAAIPDDTDVLITHGPPHGILDKTYSGESVGCKYLADRLKQLNQLKLHVFGHIHTSRGVTGTFNRHYVNAALCNEDYQPIQPVQVVTLP